MTELFNDGTTYVFRDPKCEEIKLFPGTYRISLYGAQGGQCSTQTPYGGFTTGILRNRQINKYYICIGGQGQNATEVVEGGFNGGGKNSIGRWKNCSGSGGGQTDIRTEEDNPHSVIMVAGGGGGDGEHKNTFKAGRGGGTQGDSGTGNDSFGRPGSILTGNGAGGHYTPNGYEECSAESGETGKGGNACSTALGSAGGGGAGHFGGGGGADLSSGGGGCGFFSSIIKNGKSSFSTNKGDGVAIIQSVFLIETCQCRQSFLSLVTLVLPAIFS